MIARGAMAVLGSVVLFGLGTLGPRETAWAGAEAAPAARIVDRAVVRFYAPETGGAAQPRFVDERILAFEARMEALAESSEGTGAGYDDRNVRAALDRHIGEELLSGLGQKLISGSPPWQRPTQAELRGLAEELGAALFARLGGTARVQSAAAAEGLDASEVDALLLRGALAVWYLNRAVTPILDTSEEQLREVFRTAAHPFRGQTFESARVAFRAWLLSERVRVAESAFLQSARSRLHLVVLR